MQVYIASDVLAKIDEEIEYYESIGEMQRAEQLEDYLFEAMEKAALNPYSYSTPHGFPSNYRRIIAKPFAIFYRINEKRDELTFYLIRGGSQNPLAPTTHQRLAGLAEKDRTEL